MFWGLYVLNGSLLLIGIFANKGLFCKPRGKLWELKMLIGIFTNKGLGYLQDKGQGQCSEGCIHILFHKGDRPLYSKYPKGEFVHKCRYKRPTSAMRHASMPGTNTNTTAGQCATLQWMLHARRAGCKVRRPLHFWSYSRWKILLMEYASL